MDFNVPIAGHGDSYDRYLVRLQEMRESVRIIYQCLNEMPNGPYKTPDNKIAPPRYDASQEGAQSQGRAGLSCSMLLALALPSPALLCRVFSCLCGELNECKLTLKSSHFTAVFLTH
eukprot:1158569-Pelagomonas_calceolata.AAC.4